MGFHALIWSHRQCTGDGHANHVLTHLADHVREIDEDTGRRNENWTVTTTREAIAAATEWSVSTVRRALFHLRSHGFIDWQPLADGYYVFRLMQCVHTEQRVPPERDRVPTERQARSIRTPYKEPGREPRNQESNSLKPGKETNETDQRNSTFNQTETPGSTSERRTSRGDPVYIPRQ